MMRCLALIILPLIACQPVTGVEPGAVRTVSYVFDLDLPTPCHKVDAGRTIRGDQMLPVLRVHRIERFDGLCAQVIKTVAVSGEVALANGEEAVIQIEWPNGDRREIGRAK
jgi:hypothetical protein